MVKTSNFSADTINLIVTCSASNLEVLERICVSSEVRRIAQVCGDQNKFERKSVAAWIVSRTQNDGKRRLRIRSSDLLGESHICLFINFSFSRARLRSSKPDAAVQTGHVRRRMRRDRSSQSRLRLLSIGHAAWPMSKLELPANSPSKRRRELLGK